MIAWARIERLAAADVADPDMPGATWDTWAGSLADLADAMQTSRSNAVRAIRTLREAGWISVLDAPGGASTYVVHHTPGVDVDGLTAAVDDPDTTRTTCGSGPEPDLAQVTSPIEDLEIPPLPVPPGTALEPVVNGPVGKLFEALPPKIGTRLSDHDRQELRALVEDVLAVDAWQPAELAADVARGWPVARDVGRTASLLRSRLERRLGSRGPAAAIAAEHAAAATDRVQAQLRRDLGECAHHVHGGLLPTTAGAPRCRDCRTEGISAVSA